MEDIIRTRDLQKSLRSKRRPVEALRRRPVARTVIKKGRIVAEAEPAHHRVYQSGSAVELDFRPRPNA